MSGLTQAPFARLPAPNAPLQPAGQPGPPDFRGFFPVNSWLKFHAVEGLVPSELRNSRSVHICHFAAERRQLVTPASPEAP